MWYMFLADCVLLISAVVGVIGLLFKWLIFAILYKLDKR